MAERMEIAPISREHLRRTVQVKKMVQDAVNKAEAESIRIDKKRKREQAKASKQTVKRFMSATQDMLAALEEIQRADISSVVNLFDMMSVADCIPS